jgi:hypothetical protein
LSTIKCINGHEQPSLHLTCGRCGGLVLYEEACIRELGALPKTNPPFEKVSLVYAGLRAAPFVIEERNVFVSSIQVGDDESEKVESFTIRRSEATSWFDFYSKYLDKLNNWMKFTGLGRSPYRLSVVDSRRPISVLVLEAVSQFPRNTIVLAIVADQTSTLIEQNTSYVAICTALKHGLPVIAVTASYLDDLIFYTESGGLVVRSEALTPLTHLLVGSIDGIMDMMGNDVRLAIKEHCLSAILSASDKIYPSPDNALYAQESGLSIDAKKEDIATAYLLAFASVDDVGKIDKAFASYRRQKLKDVIASDHQSYLSDSSSAVYDIMMIYGVKEGSTYGPLKKGYDAIASKVPEMNLQRLA